MVSLGAAKPFARALASSAEASERLGVVIANHIGRVGLRTPPATEDPAMTDEMMNYCALER